MDNRTKALLLLSVVLIAGLAGSVIFALQSTVKADNNTIVAANLEPTPSAITNTTARLTRNTVYYGTTI